MKTRIFQLTPGNVINWQDRPHRVCGRWTEEHYVALELTPQIVIEGSEKKVFHDHQKFMTRPIGGALEVSVMQRGSKLEQARA